MNNINSYGNRCGHNPSSPKLLEMNFHPKFPHYLKDGIEIIGNAYSNLNKLLPNIQEFKGQKGHVRSERREALVKVLQLFIYYLDIGSLTVGHNKQKGDGWISLSFISAKLNMGLKRVYRAIKDLQRSKYIDKRVRVINYKNNLRTVISVRVFETLFRHLGISHLKVMMGKHFKNKKEVLNQQVNIKKTIPPVYRQVNKPSPSSAKVSHAKRLYNLKAIELMKQNIPISQIRTMLDPLITRQ